jgi:hypothetical protein
VLTQADRPIARVEPDPEPTESFYGHFEESFLKSAPAATRTAIRDAARLTAS